MIFVDREFKEFKEFRTIPNCLVSSRYWDSKLTDIRLELLELPELLVSSYMRYLYYLTSW